MKIAFLIALFCLAFLPSLWLGLAFLASFGFGFLASILVVLASFYGYKARINKQLENGQISADFKELDEDDDEELEREEDIKKFILAQKAKRKFLPSLSSMGGYFLPLRLLAYGFFVLGFFVLKRQDLLSESGLLASVAAGVMTAIILKKG